MAKKSEVLAEAEELLGGKAKPRKPAAKPAAKPPAPKPAPVAAERFEATLRAGGAAAFRRWSGEVALVMVVAIILILALTAFNAWMMAGLLERIAGLSAQLAACP